MIRPLVDPRGVTVADIETERRLVEIEKLLNDPEVRMDAHRVWALLAEIRLRAVALPHPP